MQVSLKNMISAWAIAHFYSLIVPRNFNQMVIGEGWDNIHIRPKVNSSRECWPIQQQRAHLPAGRRRYAVWKWLRRILRQTKGEFQHNTQSSAFMVGVEIKLVLQCWDDTSHCPKIDSTPTGPMKNVEWLGDKHSSQFSIHQRLYFAKPRDQY